MRRSWAVRAYVEMGVESAAPGSWVAFVTVTEGSAPREAREHFAAVSRFLEDVQRLQGGPRPYVGVREIQERRQERTGVAVWHSHVVMLGWRRIDLADLRAAAARHGLGRVNVKVEKVPPRGLDGSGLARYMGKGLSTYMVKSSVRGDSWGNVMAHLPVGCRLVFSSRSWAEGVTLAQVERDRLAERRRAAMVRALGSMVELGEPLVGTEEAVTRAALAALAAAGLLALDPDPPPAAVPDQLTIPGAPAA